MPSTSPPATVGHATHATHNAALSWLEINLARLEANVRTFRAGLGTGAWRAGSVRGQANHPRLCGVIKKAAYGLGELAIAHRMVKAGCDMLAVYAPHEAERLIADAIDAPILVLMPLRTLSRTGPLYRHATKGKLHLSVHDPDQLRALDALGHSFGLRWPVHLFVDTGMSRSGLDEAQWREVLEMLPRLRFIEPTGVCSHLASADEDPTFTDHQRQRFESIVNEARPLLSAEVMCHLANTFATLRDRALHKDMVRCGIGLLGYGPESMHGLSAGAVMPELQPVL